MGKFNETTVSRSQLSDTRARRALVICMSVLFLGMTQVCWAEEHVITMYFGGTGLVETGYVGAKTRWDTPSLLSVMHWYQRDSSYPAAEFANQHKIFVPGVGAREDSSGDPPNHCEGNPKIWFPLDLVSHAFLQQKDGHMPICRNWKFTISEAGVKLATLVNGLGLQVGDTIVLNVIGHSRGAIAAMWFVDQALKDTMILDDWSDDGTLAALNLVVLEPVPGMGLLSDDYSAIEEYDVGDVWGNDPLGHDPMGWDIFRPDNRVEKVVAIYAEDERSNKFGAVVPYIHIGADRMLFRVRGSHQTMVGSLWKGGHSPQSFPIICPYPYTGPLCEGAVHEPDLIAVHNVVAITLVELLGGPGWGGVKFSNHDGFLEEIYESDNFDGTDNQRKALFGTQVSNMRSSQLDKHYKLMHQSAFFPGPLWPTGLLTTVAHIVPPIPLEEFRGNDCKRLYWGWEGVLKPWSLTSEYSRCMQRVTKPGSNPGHLKQGLENMHDIPELTNDSDDPFDNDTAWEKISSMREAHRETAPAVIAEANGPYVVECSGYENVEDVQLDSTGSLPGPGGVDLTYKWSIGNLPIIEGQDPEHANPLVTLPLGSYDVYMFVYDGVEDDGDQTWITVQDTTPPVIDCPENVVVECTGPQGAAASFAEPTAVDSCHAWTTPTCSHESGSTFPLGENIVACFNYDHSPKANRGHCLFNVKVNDSEAPVIQGISKPLAVYLDSVLLHKTLGTADFVSAVSDNCAALTLDDLQIISVTPASPLQIAPGKPMPLGAEINPDGKSVTLGEGTFSIEIQVADAAGNTTTRAFDVRVLSPIPIPAISRSAIIILVIGLTLLGFWGLRRRRVT